MSSRWIVLGDTRVNVEAQSARGDGQAVVEATLRLYAVHTIPQELRELAEPQAEDYL